MKLTDMIATLPLRQYWPKSADLRGLTDIDRDAVALQLNIRPRKTLEWQTPARPSTRGSLQQPFEPPPMSRRGVVVVFEQVYDGVSTSIRNGSLV